MDLWPSWQNACRPFFRAYATASASGDLGAMFSTLLALFKLPASCLLRSRGGKIQRRGIRSLLANIRNTASRSVLSVASHQSLSSSVPDKVDPIGDRLSCPCTYSARSLGSCCSFFIPGSSAPSGSEGYLDSSRFAPPAPALPACSFGSTVDLAPLTFGSIACDVLCGHEISFQL